MQPITTTLENHRAIHRHQAKKFILIIYASWFLALAIGALTYAGEEVIKRHELPLRHFDAIFRRIGGMIIFGAWSLRAAAKHVLHLRGDGRWDHIWIPGALYAVQLAARSIIYQLHHLGVIFSPHHWLTAHQIERAEHPPHVMSDHVLLAATLVGGLSCEVAVLYLSLAHRKQKLSPVVLKGLAAAATALALLISAECYYTAKYFHPPEEIMVGAVLGLVVFQAPLLLFSAKLLKAHEQADGDAVAKLKSN